MIKTIKIAEESTKSTPFSHAFVTYYRTLGNIINYLKAIEDNFLRD